MLKAFSEVLCSISDYKFIVTLCIGCSLSGDRCKLVSFLFYLLKTIIKEGRKEDCSELQ